MAADASQVLIAHVLSSMDPSGGGPIEGVLQLANQLNQLGHRTEAITLDAPGQKYFSRFPGAVHALGPSRSSYRYNARLVPFLRSRASAYDAVIINGLWQYHSFGSWRVLARMHVPYYVFPHGMLDPWFRHTYPLKHLKKCLYWPWAEYRVLRDARSVLFTTEEERRLASRSFSLYRANERVVSYGIGAPPADTERLRRVFLDRYPEYRGQRLLLYLGRLHEKKGCDLLLRAFASVAAVDPRLRLVMAGPDNVGWGSVLRKMAQDLAISDRVGWPGMLRDDLKWGAFYCAEAFILPSHQENFGVAVAEALACGVPVLISNKVNIWREVAAAKAGLIDNDDMDGTQRLLTGWLALDTAAKEQMGRSAIRTFERKFHVGAMAADMLSLMKESFYPQLANDE